jgi:ligand-binding SRPBCC domain-containing protein
MRHAFKTEQWVPYPIEKVFSFFANPENLPRLMPAWQQARIEVANFVAPPPSPSPLQTNTTAAGTGTTMTISFRALPFLPLRLNWEALIVEFGWNDHFCDEQPKGPFAYWRHCHHVSERIRAGEPGTLVVDDLTYELPFGILAEPAHALFARRQIETIFKYRQQELLKLLA